MTEPIRMHIAQPLYALYQLQLGSSGAVLPFESRAEAVAAARGALAMARAAGLPIDPWVTASGSVWNQPILLDEEVV